MDMKEGRLMGNVAPRRHIQEARTPSNQGDQEIRTSVNGTKLAHSQRGGRNIATDLGPI